MAIPAIEIEITADPSGAVVGFNKINKSLDGLEEAARQYKAELDKVNRAERTGLVASQQAAKAIRQAEIAYENAARSAASYSGATVSMTKATQGATRGFRGLNSGVVQNASFQIADFATQVSGGTSATVALGQQLPQLLGAFGALGAAAGAVVAIGVPLAGALLNTGEKAKDASEATDDFTEALRSFSTVSRAANGSLEALRSEFGLVDEAARRAADALREIAARELKAEFDDLNASLLEGGNEVAKFIGKLAKVEEARQSAKGARKEIEEFPAPVRAAAMALDQFQQQGTDDLDAMRASASTTLDSLVALNDPAYDELVKSLGGIVAALGKVREEAGKTRGALSFKPQGGGRGADPRAFDTEGRFGSGMFVPSQDVIDQANRILNPSTRGAGGGQGQSDGIGAFAKSLMNQSEALETWRQDGLAKLQDFNAMELEVLGGHAEAKARIEEEYQNRLGNLQEQERRSRIQGIQGALGDASALMKTENKKLFEIGKTAAQANAAVSGYEAAVSAWKTGMAIGGPPVAGAFAAASLAKTGALISAISSQSIGGGGGGGGGSAPSVASAAAPEPQTVTEIRFFGNLGTTGEELVEILNAEASRGNLVRATVG